MPHENYNYQTTANVPNYQQQSSSQRSYNDNSQQHSTDNTVSFLKSE